MIQASDSFANYDQQPQLNSCRICLQPCKGDPQPFCNCKGNSKYVHEACLLEWGKRANKFKTKQAQIYFLCDLCQTPIYLQLQKQYKCRQLQEVKQIKGLTKFQFCLLLSTTIIFSVISAFCLRTLLDNTQLNVILTVLVIVFSLVSLSSLSILIYRLFFSALSQVKGLKRFEPTIFKNRIANTHTLQNL